MDHSAGGGRGSQVEPKASEDQRFTLILGTRAADPFRGARFARPAVDSGDSRVAVAISDLLRCLAGHLSRPSDQQRILQDLQRHLEEGRLGLEEISERLPRGDLRLLREKPGGDSVWPEETLERLVALVEIAESRQRDSDASRARRPAQPIPNRRGAAAHGMPDLQVLLIGFEPADHVQLLRLLEQSPDTHFQVRSVESAAKAPELLQQGSFDVALLDLTRPAENGSELLARAEVVTCGIPVISLVGREQDSELIGIGAHSHLERDDLDASLLARVLCNAVEQHHFVQALDSSQKADHTFATCDPLTGLPNRHAFRDQLQRALFYAERQGQQVAVLIVHVDGWKQVNALGQEAGDGLLITLAERIQAALRRSDMIARIGGEEFLVMLQGPELDLAPARTAERLLEDLSQSFFVDGREHHTSASIGIAAYPRDGADPDILIRRAAAAVGKARIEARNGYRFYGHSVNAMEARRLTVADRLRGVLDRGDLAVHYQPRVDARTGSIVGAEALLRWIDTGIGSVSPAEFVPIAERAGLMCDIGAWVLREACFAHRHWSDAGFGDLRVSVNVSAHQLQSASLRDAVIDAMLGARLAPGRLEIELTESALVDNQNTSASLLRELAEIGVSLALDDFGTGFSSLSYLRQFPVRTLKIDPSFVREITSESRCPSLVEAILSLGSTLGIDIVAEGVETEVQRDVLLERGCHAMQGFLFSRPVPGEELLALLQTGRPLAPGRAQPRA